MGNWEALAWRELPEWEEKSAAELRVVELSREGAGEEGLERQEENQGGVAAWRPRAESF